jgi:diacylglycerol O-acyltransferase / wax synthase
MPRPIQPLDLAFLWLDRPDTPANVGALLLFDPPPGRSSGSVVRQVVRAYRKTRPSAPFDRIPDLPVFGLPQWRDAARIDLRRHVRLERLAPPGDLDQLCRHVARLHEGMLDRMHPLFSLNVIDGLASGRWALYLKSHHAYWDGRYALERIFGSLGREPGALGLPFFAAADVAGEPAPASADVAGSLAGGLRGLLAQASGLRELFTSLSARARPHTGPPAAAGNRPFAGPHTRLNDPVAAGRTYACFSLPLEEMRHVAHGAGGTINDVVLAVVDAGVTRFLASAGERPPQPLVAMCPVSMREPGDREATSKVATLFVPLGSPRQGAATRLRRIVANTQAAKAEFRGLSREAALDYAALAFGLWFASSTLGLGAITRPVINLVVSNVGAVEGPRYLGASRLAAAFPVSMLADPAGLNVTTVSVNDRMDFGIVANAAAVADAGEIARACETAFEELRCASRRPRRVAGQRSGTGPSGPVRT